MMYYVRLPAYQFVQPLNSDGPDQGAGLEPNNSRSAAYLNIQNQTRVPIRCLLRSLESRNDIFKGH